MVAGLGLILILSIPLVLSGGSLGATARVRQIFLRVCVVMSAIAVVLWLVGLDTLPLAVLSFVPVYQIELYALMMKRFRNNYGRELELMISGIVTDSELKKDAHYSTAYFAGAVGLALLVLGLFLA